MKVILGVLVGLVIGGVTVYVLSDTNEDSPLPPTTVTLSPTLSEPVDSTPSPSDDDASNENSCSAAGLDTILTTSEDPNEGLPPPVAAMRSAILNAALDCDYEELERLALEGREFFSYSFGVEKSPASFWRAREREARRSGQETSEYMRYLIEILQRPYCTERNDDGTGTDTKVTYYIWPRVHCSNRTAEDWNDLKGVYTNDQIQQMRAADLYYGFRVGILEDGDWVYFIAGD